MKPIRIILIFLILIQLKTNLECSTNIQHRPLQAIWEEIVELEEYKYLSWQEQQLYKLTFYIGALKAIQLIDGESPTRNYTKDMKEDCNDYLININPRWEVF